MTRTIDEGPANLLHTDTTAFSFSSPDPGATFACTLTGPKGTSTVACTSPHHVGSLADGAHTFSVRATDSVGQVDATPATA